MHIAHYYYMMPRVAKVCDIIGVHLLSISMVAASVLLYQNAEGNRSYLGLGVLGVSCLIARDVLRVYRTTPSIIKIFKFTQCALIACGMVAAIGFLATEDECYLKASVGIIGSVTVVHYMIKTASHIL